MKSFLGNFYRHLAIFFWSHWPPASEGTNEVSEGGKNLGNKKVPKSAFSKTIFNHKFVSFWRDLAGQGDKSRELLRVHLSDHYNDDSGTLGRGVIFKKL